MTKRRALTAKGQFVCTAVCSECPFRIVGTHRVRFLDRIRKQGIVESLRNGDPFSCHLTTESKDRAKWRFCAGAYLAMSEEERLHSQTLQIVTALKAHSYDTPPKGKNVVISSLDEFINLP